MLKPKTPWMFGEDAVVDIVHATELINTHRSILGFHPLALLKQILSDVWRDAYTEGWSDGRANRDPSEKENPYDLR